MEERPQTRIDKPSGPKPGEMGSPQADAVGWFFFIVGIGVLIWLAITLFSWGYTVWGTIAAIGTVLLAIFMDGIISSRIQGPCPHCSSWVVALEGNQGIDCPGCKRRLLIRDKKFYPVDAEE